MNLKRITASFMCIILCISLIHVNVQAETTDEGTVTWDLAADGTLTISGDGTIGEAEFENNESITSIVIKKGVVGIGRFAFKNCTNLKNVAIPESVTTIQQSAFENCKKIASVTLPEGLTTLYGYAFKNCTGLTSIAIPSSLTTVNEISWNGPFNGCSNMKTVTFDGSRTEIPRYLLEGSGVTDVDWSDDVERIGRGAFENCTNLKSITFPNTVTEIGEYSFKKCSNLQDVQLSTSTKVIEQSAFEECKKITSVILPEGLTTLYGYAFKDCTALTSIAIPSSLTTVNEISWNGPFNGCSNMKTVTFNGSRTKIPRYLLEGSGVTDVDWSDDVERIERAAFENCTYLKSITFPNTVTEIGEYSFKKCSNLQDVQLSTSTKVIEQSAFEECKKITSVTLPEGLTTLYGYAFANCIGLEKIDIPSSLTTVNQISYTGPFTGCTNMKTVTFKGSRTIIPVYIMAGSGVDRVNWSYNIKTISQSAFENCKYIDSIIIPNSVTSIGDYAFRYCDALKDIKFSDSIETIGHHAFGGCSSLEKVSFPKALKEISYNSFENCTSLSEIYVQKKLATIGTDAFRNDNNFEAFAPKFSDSTVLLIDKGINMSFSDTYHVEEASDVIDWTATSFDMSDTSASGYIPIILKYALKEKYQDKLTDMKIIIPDQITDVKVDGVQVDITTDKSGHAIIPISKNSGTVSIYTAPNSYGKVVSYAKLEYKNGSTAGSILLGAVSERTSCLTLGTTDKISYETGSSSVNVPITGFAVKQKDVDIYVDDTSVGTVNASLSGIYKTEITLQSPDDYKRYKIKAVSVNNAGKEVAVEKDIYTVLEAPELTEANLYIEAHDYKNGSANFDLLDDEGKIKYIVFQPGKKYQFRLKYTHADRLSKVFVVSTRSGARKVLQAKWNADAKAYITDGYFDNDSSYVPGNISVEYVLNGEKSKVSDDGKITFTNKEYAKIPDKWKNATVKENTNSTSDYEAEVILGDGDDIIYTYDEMSFKEFADVLRSEYINGTGSSTVAGSFLGAQDKSSSSSSSSKIMTQSNISDLIDVLEQTGDTGENISDLYGMLKSFGFVEYLTGEANLDKDLSELNRDVNAMMKFDYSGEDIVAYLIDPSQCGNNIEKYVFKRANGAMKKSVVEMMGDKATGNFAYTMGGSIIDFEEESINLLMARTTIMSNPSLSEAERAAKLAELDKARDIACEKLALEYMAAALMVMGTTSSVTGIGVALVILSKIIDKCIIPMVESGDLDKFIKGDISLKSMIIRWILDPSGYVYEGVTTNRISEVKTTLYYKETENSTKETLWDSTEYGQDNPLYTDNEGCYAWDVPEGYWRVKYEKDGYDTIYSDWMPVPPPQTDVNIAMVPTAAPKVESINVYESYTIVAFDQYMDPATITNIELADSDDNKVDYTLSYDKSETDAAGSVYAKSFTLKYKNKKITGDDTLSVTVPETVKSSGGKSVESSQSNGTSQKDASLTISEMVHVKQGETIEIPYSTKGADDEVITVKIDNTDIARFVSVESDASKNEGMIIVEGEVYGTTKMLVTLGSTGVVKNVEIKVDTYSAIEEPAQDDVSGDDYISGDVNGDGTVNSTDVILVRRYIAGGYNVTINDKAADVNDDGTVNSTDVILIRRYIAGGYGVILK